MIDAQPPQQMRPDRRAHSILTLLTATLVAVLGVMLLGVGTAAADSAVEIPNDNARVIDGPGDTVMVVYQNGGNTIVRYCDDRACESWTTEVALSGVQFFASSATLLADEDGRLLILDGASLVRCDDPSCGGSSVTTTPMPALRRIRLTSDGRVGGVTFGRNPDVVFCVDPACTSTTTHPLPTSNGDTAELVNDEFIVTTVDRLNSQLTTYRCNNGCASATAGVAPLPTALFPSGETRISLFTFSHPGASTLTHLLQVGPASIHIGCDTLDCANPVATMMQGQVNTNVGVDIDSVGNLVYVNPTIIGLSGRVISCFDPSCTDRQTSPNFNFVRRLSVDAHDRPQLLLGRYLYTCDPGSCTQSDFDPVFRGWCVNSTAAGGAIDMSVIGNRDPWTLRSGQAEVSTKAVAGPIEVIRMVGRDGNGPVAAIGALNGVEAGSAVLNFACSGVAVHDASWTCQGDRGRVDVRVASAATPATFAVQIGSLPTRTITIDANTPVDEIRGGSIDHPTHGSVITTATARPDGQLPVTITDTATDAVVFSRTFTIRCGFLSVAGPEVTIVQTCLAGRGRIDTNLTNSNVTDTTYFVSLFRGADRRPFIVRQRTLVPGDWGRIPISGRANEPHRVVVTTGDGAVVASRTMGIQCEDGVESVSEPALQIVNACRSGLGYIMFLFTNPTADAQSVTLEFDGVPNRSTTIAPFGQSVKFVTGRPDNTYSGQVVGGEQFSVDVACDALGAN